MQSPAHTHTGMHRHTKTRVHTCRRCHVTIFPHSGVSLPHDNCEFNWCCHMVCNGVSSDCRGCVKETQIFLEEKRRLSRAGIKKKKKTPLFWLAFLLPLLSRCWNANSLTPHAGGKRDIYSSFFLSVRKFLLAPSSPRDLVCWWTCIYNSPAQQEVDLGYRPH